MSWDLSRHGAEFYAVEIVTEPQLDTWEISFDYGATWHEMIYDVEDHTQRILVCGPEAPTQVGSVMIQTNVAPLVRSVSNPEVIVRTSPTIMLVS